MCTVVKSQPGFILTGHKMGVSFHENQGFSRLHYLLPLSLSPLYLCLSACTLIPRAGIKNFRQSPHLACAKGKLYEQDSTPSAYVALDICPKENPLMLGGFLIGITTLFGTWHLPLHLISPPLNSTCSLIHLSRSR